MKSCAYILGIALLSYSVAYTGIEIGDIKQGTLLHHQFHIGPEVFITHSQEKRFEFEIGEEKRRFDSLLGGLRANYDYVKPQAFYFGTSGFFARGNDRVEYRLDDGQSIWFYERKGSPFLVNIEQRSGYTLQTSQKLLVTPFAGVGSYYIKTKARNNVFSANWLYGTAGVRILHPCFNLGNSDWGFNLKIMYSFAGKQREQGSFGLYKNRFSNIWGYELGVPFKWHMGRSRAWSLQFEPYLTKINIKINEQSGGARFITEYGF